MIKPGKFSASEARQRAFMAADWFVNTQVVHHEPCLDANHGRIFYNYYLPKRSGPRGLSWSHGRAIMCLLGAWELSKGKKEYLDAAVRCGLYLRYGLQIMDARNPLSFGAFREEVPVSRFAYPRDAIEAAFGLLMLYMATNEKDYLERCEIFANWFLTQVIDPETKWARGAIFFDEPERRAHNMKFFQAGGAPFFWHLYQITGNKKYLNRGLKPMADGLIKHFIDPETGAMISASNDAHHTITNAKGINLAINDDGASVALTCAHAAFGSNSRVRYMESAIRYADWMVEQSPQPSPLWAAPGVHAVTLLEIGEITGNKKYKAAAAGIMERHVANQIVDASKLDRHGAFRGEDENVKWYVPGAKPRDFITTRSTAYGCFALLRLAGISGPFYSALGLERFQNFCAKMNAGKKS